MLEEWGQGVLISRNFRFMPILCTVRLTDGEPAGRRMRILGERHEYYRRYLRAGFPRHLGE